MEYHARFEGEGAGGIAGGVIFPSYLDCDFLSFRGFIRHPSSHPAFSPFEGEMNSLYEGLLWCHRCYGMLLRC